MWDPSHTGLPHVFLVPALTRLVEVTDLLPTLMQISAQTNEEFYFFYCACIHINKRNILLGLL